MAGGKGRDDADELKERETLQAVLLADSFLTTFRPLSLEEPKCLLPLNNVRLLDYAFDFLASNGVEEVYVVCTSDKLEQSLKETIVWNGRMQVFCIKDSSLTNSGDALRELYKRNVIKSDPFLLLFGDVVTNMDLTAAMQAHKDRHAKDSAAIMTLILKQVGTDHHTTNDLCIGMDTTPNTNSTNRILLYDNSPNNEKIKLPCSFFQAHPQIEIFDDLADTGVGICSPDVLGRFEDEFDYLDISQHFVTNCVAEEEEGLQSRIFGHILAPNEYATRVTNLSLYHHVSMDLLRRWCYPMVPDNLLNSHSPQVYKAMTRTAKYQYKEMKEPSKVARSSTLVGPGMMGSNGMVGESSSVIGCVIGHNVNIGSNVTMKDSHVWDHVTIEDNATIQEAIIAQDCIIHKNATISKGCVLGQGVVIDENTVVPEFTRITLAKDEDDDWGDDDDDDWLDDDEDEEDDGGDRTGNAANASPGLVSEDAHDHNVVGPNGKGRVWKLNDDDEDSEDEEDRNIPRIQLQSIGGDLEMYHQYRLKRQMKADEDDDWSEKNRNELEAERMETEAFSAYTDGAFTFENEPTTSAVPSTNMVFGRQKGVDVVQELKDICLEFEETSPMENLAIELNSYKFSQNASYSDCTMGTMLAILEKMEISPDMSDGKLVGTLKQRLQFWAPLLQKMSIGEEEEKAIIRGLELAATQDTKSGNDAIRNKLGSGPSFRFVLQTLHDEEVLSEEAILSWAEDRKLEDKGTPIGMLFNMESVQQFLEWLEEESEEEDSDDDDDDDSD